MAKSGGAVASLRPVHPCHPVPPVKTNAAGMKKTGSDGAQFANGRAPLPLNVEP
jgi:hypothetical protein